MNFKKRLLTPLLFSVGYVLVSADVKQQDNNSEPALSFVIKPADVKKGASKNDIKEDIGESIKTALHSCAELSKTLGEVQVELSKIQTQLFSNVEALIDNKTQYKHASRNNLKQSLGVMQKMNKELSLQVTQIKQLKVEMNNDKCLKVS